MCKTKLEKLLLICSFLLPFSVIADEQPPTNPAPDTLKEALAHILQTATTGLDNAISFLSAQVPDVVHQLLMWNLVLSTSQFVTAIVIPILWVVYGKKYLTWWRGLDEYKDEGTIVCGAVFGIVFFCFSIFCSFFLFNLQWLEILVAPKVYLIEYAAKLIK